MLFSVNYSHAAAELYRSGKIQVDLFKCPAWPDAVELARRDNDVYVHFPLSVGAGSGDAIDTEMNRPANWEEVELFLASTRTPVVNLHLGATKRTYPFIPADTTDPAHIDMLTERLIADVTGVVKRFGPECVVVENVHNGSGKHLRPSYLPEVVSQVVRETGCGLLLDLSHAQLAAHHLDMDIGEYLDALPREAIRELHVTGIQRFEGRWISAAREVGFAQADIEAYRGRLVDHLPMTAADWSFFTWSIDQIERRLWGKPWVVTFEYGGLGGTFAPFTDSEVIQAQVPKMVDIVKGVGRIDEKTRRESRDKRGG